MQEYGFPTQQDIERAEAHLRRIELEERAAREQLERDVAELHYELHRTWDAPSECATCQS